MGGAGPSRDVLSEPASFVFLEVGAGAKWRRARAPPRAPAAETAISRNLPERTQKNLKILRVISVPLFQGALATWGVISSEVGLQGSRSSGAGDCWSLEQTAAGPLALLAKRNRAPE